MDPYATRIAPDYTATLLELVHHPCAIEALPGRGQKGKCADSNVVSKPVRSGTSTPWSRTPDVENLDMCDFQASSFPLLAFAVLRAFFFVEVLANQFG
jgi:hypothetical protein